MVVRQTVLEFNMKEGVTGINTHSINTPYSYIMISDIDPRSSVRILKIGILG